MSTTNNSALAILAASERHLVESIHATAQRVDAVATVGVEAALGRLQASIQLAQARVAAALAKMDAMVLTFAGQVDDLAAAVAEDVATAGDVSPLDKEAAALCEDLAARSTAYDDPNELIDLSAPGEPTPAEPAKTGTMVPVPPATEQPTLAITTAANAPVADMPIPAHTLAASERPGCEAAPEPTTPPAGPRKARKAKRGA